MKTSKSRSNSKEDKTVQTINKLTQKVSENRLQKNETNESDNKDSTRKNSHSNNKSKDK